MIINCLTCKVAPNNIIRTCMLEFTDYGAIIPAMRLNNTDINGNEIKVFAWTFSRRVVVCQIYGLCWGH